MIFKIVDRKISVESEVVLSYSLDYVATFEFDEEWNNKIVTARFVHENGNMVEVVLDSENSCNIPLFPKGVVNVGVYTDEFTSTYAPMRIYTSIKDIGEYEVIPPTADVYQQIISLIEEGRIKGDDGFSPTVDIEDIEGGHTVVITDAEGDKEFDVMDGSDYIITESDYQAIAERTKDLVPTYDDTEIRGEIEIVKGDLTDKLTKPNEVAVGKYFRVASLDSEGNPVLEAVDLPIANRNSYGAVKESNGFLARNGEVLANNITNSVYENVNNNYFIGKGTLENVLAERLKEKEWTLKGTLTTENKNVGVNVDLSGCTEMVIVAKVTATQSTNLYCLISGVSKQLIVNISGNGVRTTYVTYKESPIAIECASARYAASDTNVLSIVATATSFLNEKIEHITRINLGSPAYVTECNIEIYAR